MEQEHGRKKRIHPIGRKEKERKKKRQIWGCLKRLPQGQGKYNSAYLSRKIFHDGLIHPPTHIRTMNIYIKWKCYMSDTKHTPILSHNNLSFSLPLHINKFNDFIAVRARPWVTRMHWETIGVDCRAIHMEDESYWFVEIRSIIIKCVEY